MPFTPIKDGPDKGKYRSPSGRVYSWAQVKLYHAHNGFPSKDEKKPPPKPKKEK